MDKAPNLAEGIKDFFKGDIASDETARDFYSHDASLFELKPDLIVYPKDTADICGLVNYVNQHKHSSPNLSLTARSGGTDMSGGAINDSIIVAFERYFTSIGSIRDGQVAVQPGVYYRDFEPRTLEQGLLMPTYPASRELCMIGGMVANNAGGEKSLVYGKTDRYVHEVKIVLRDGQEHTFGTIDRAALDLKLAEKSLEGDLYRGLYHLVTEHRSLLAAQRPKVSKNSTAYNLWDVWDGKTFDITKVIVGSQGTLGLLT
jgi:FAD/FMN-containing dehydrogenase